MTNLSKAFLELRKAGITARQNFWCCQSCGCAAIDDHKKEKDTGWCFYHNQDNADKIKGKPFHLTFGGHEVNGKEMSDEDVVKTGNLIITILNENGVETNWNGDINKRILITKW